MSAPVVSLQGVTKSFRTSTGIVPVLQDVSFDIQPHETLGLIGESGSGKSTLGRVVLGLEPPDRGRVTFDSTDIYQSPTRSSWRRAVSIVLQEPQLALNPRMTVGQSVCEALIEQMPQVKRQERRQLALAALDRAHLSPVVWHRYPHELSGGQLQRIAIARAIAAQPRFVVLDEPTASLDLPVRRRVLDTLTELQADLGLSYLLISHDLRTVQRVAHRTAVLYRGCILEVASTSALFGRPAHPYTKALLSSVLSPDPAERAVPLRLRPQGPATLLRQAGCVLSPRCPWSDDSCIGHDICLTETSDGRSIACANLEQVQ